LRVQCQYDLRKRLLFHEEIRIGKGQLVNYILCQYDLRGRLLFLEEIRMGKGQLVNYILSMLVWKNLLSLVFLFFLFI
jgi:hypothetical protein